MQHYKDTISKMEEETKPQEITNSGRLLSELEDIVSYHCMMGSLLKSSSQELAYIRPLLDANFGPNLTLLWLTRANKSSIARFFIDISASLRHSIIVFLCLWTAGLSMCTVRSSVFNATYLKRGM